MSDLKYWLLRKKKFYKRSSASYLGKRKFPLESRESRARMEAFQIVLDHISQGTFDSVVEVIADYIENESECIIPIVVEETRQQYGARVVKALAEEIREKFAEV